MTAPESFAANAAGTQASDLEARAGALAEAAGLSGPLRLEAVAGGRNNRAFIVHGAGRRAFLKVYFRHPQDPRDRFGTERAFLEHARSLGLTCVPRILAADAEAGMTLLECVDGRRLAPGEAAWPRVEQALRFFLALNGLAGRAETLALPEASEACFSIGSHLGCVERRLARLRAAAGSGATGPEAAAFILESLAPAWETCRERVAAEARTRLGPDWDAPLEAALRRLSPSDFGFHNALERPDGALCFLDFEYGGWDDPAKTVCDFFCQPEIPVPGDLLDPFQAALAEAFPEDRSLAARVGLLLPVHQLKWCCILLNEFLPVSAARRDFAGGSGEDGRRGQLAKAREALRNALRTQR